ncbi:MAG TPA: hypothetical protein VID49_04310 [Steroidobacteraceae bacterium]|jgi:hypothetical protein
MESLSWRRILAALALAGLTTVMGATAWADTQAEGSAGVPAVWTAKELRFVYMGFTSHYSCDGLRDKIRVILTDFGARDDLQVSEGPCTDLGRPTRFPGVNIKINVLQPAGDATDSSVVAAHWKRVQLPGPGDAVRQAGDCELVEQVKQKILPLFATRDVQYHSTCVPKQLSIGGTSLSADVLVPDQPTAKPAVAQ